MFLIGVTLFVGTIIFTMAKWGIIGAFIDSSSILFVLLSYLALMLTTRSLSDFTYGIKVVTSKKTVINKKRLSDAIDVFHLLQKASIGIGILGFLIGLVLLLNVLSDPSSIGPSLAVSLLTATYCVIVTLVFLTPVKFLLNRVAKRR